MASAVLERSTREAIDLLTAGLDALHVAGVEPVDRDDAVALVREMEVIGRRVRSSQVDLVGAIEQRGLHRLDGHATAKVFVRHHGRLSNAEAGRRARAAAALRHLPTVRAAYAGGRIGIDHLDRLARTFANPRLREQFIAQDEALAVLGATRSHAEFDARLAAWERLADEDGTRDRNQRHHENRTFDLRQEFDSSWSVSGGGGALDGARADAVLRALLAAEEALDWAKARAEHGDAATADQLPRTAGQRRWDAFAHALDLAAAGFAATEGGAPITTDLVMDHATFVRESARLAGAPVPAAAPDLDATEGPVRPPESPGRVEYRCSTLQGHRLEATEAVAAALLGRLRRVVVGADSVVIDLGRRRRCFTGPAQLAAQLSATWCYWPGCLVPAARCQIDHLQPWSVGGRTRPGNGAPCCGTHNRFKEAGYTVRRDPDGQIRTYRPDGSELT